MLVTKSIYSALCIFFPPCPSNRLALRIRRTNVHVYACTTGSVRSLRLLTHPPWSVHAYPCSVQAVAGDLVWLTCELQTHSIITWHPQDPWRPSSCLKVRIRFALRLGSSSLCHISHPFYYKQMSPEKPSIRHSFTSRRRVFLILFAICVDAFSPNHYCREVSLLAWRVC